MADYLATILTLTLIYAIVSVGLNIQWGYAGLINLSIITSLGVGGYVSAVFTMTPAAASGGTQQYVLGLQMPFLVGAAAGMGAAAALGLVLGAIALNRIRATYLAIVTLCVGEIIHQFVGAYTPLFNGFYGLYTIPQPFLEIVPGGQKYYDFFYLGMCLIALGAVYLVAERLRKSPFGRVLRAVREDREAARAFGRDVVRFQLKAFVIGSAVAGLGGALLVHFIGGFNPAGWTFAETFLIYASVFLGGSGNNRGVILGAVIVVGLLGEAARLIPQGFMSGDQLPALQSMVIGALMIAILRWRPAGLLVEPIYKDPDRLGVAQ